MRRTVQGVLVVILLLSVLGLSGCNKLRARDELNKGVRAYRAAQFQAAIEHFKKAIEYDPSLINARLYLATAYASQYIPGAPSEENIKMGEAAIAEFQKVLEMDPNNTAGLASIGSIYFNMGKFDQSKQYNQKLIKLDPNNPEPYYWIGVIDWTLTFKPRMELKTKLGLKPDQPLPPKQREELAATNLATVEEGIQALKKAMDLRPEYDDAMAYLNLMYREKADLVESSRERDELLAAADELVQRTLDIKKKRAEAPASGGGITMQ